MRLVVVTSVYPEYRKSFYARHPGLARRSYQEQRRALAEDTYSWHNVQSHYLAPLGYEVLELVLNVDPLQRAWGRENGLAQAAWMSLEQIAVEQIGRFKPDIVWFDVLDAKFIRAVRQRCPLRLAMGWVGSPSARPAEVWRELDVVLSCAPETVERLEGLGVAARHLDHAFDPRVNQKLRGADKDIPLSFLGQILRGDEYHLEREAVLLQLVSSGVPVGIYSSSRDYGMRKEAEAVAKMLLHGLTQGLRRAGAPERLLQSIPLVKQAMLWKSRPGRPVNPALRPHLRPGAYGMEMYELLRRSLVCLNIHADSSPRHVSNLRMFEITGVGTCMLCDWRANLPRLFAPDTEVVAYRSAQECAEKARWLMDHPDAARAIGKAGQERCLRDHSFARRVRELDGIIRGELQRRASP